MNDTISLDDVRLFLGVARRRSFGRAAREAAVPASTLSRRVATLEARLGVRLLQRTSRSVSLTEEGARLAERAAPLITSLDAAVERVRGDDAPEGLLRVTAPVASGSERLAPALFAFAARHPRLRLELVLTNAVVDLVEEGVDLAFRAGPVQDQGLVARRLWRVDFGLAASPVFVARELAGRTELDRAALERLPAVVQRPSPWRLVHRGGAVESVSPRVRVSVNDPRVALTAACAGLGVLLAPRELVAQAGRRLVPLSVRGCAFEPRELFAVYPSRGLLPARVRMAVDWVLATARPT